MERDALGLLLLGAVSCGGSVNATNGVTRDAGTDVAADANAPSDPFTMSGLTLLDSSALSQIQSSTCYQPKSIEISADSGVAGCAIVVPDPSSGSGGPTLWGGCSKSTFVYTLQSGQQYEIRVTTDCATGGVQPGPNGYDEVVFCPSTCSLLAKHKPGTLNIYVGCSTICHL